MVGKFKIGNLVGLIVVRHTIDYIILANREGILTDELLIRLENEFKEAWSYQIRDGDDTFVIIRKM